MSKKIIVFIALVILFFLFIVSITYPKEWTGIERIITEDYILDIQYRDYDNKVIYKARMTLIDQINPVFMVWKTFSKEVSKKEIVYKEIRKDYYPNLETFDELSDSVQIQYITVLDSALSKY